MELDANFATLAAMADRDDRSERDAETMFERLRVRVDFGRGPGGRATGGRGFPRAPAGALGGAAQGAGVSPAPPSGRSRSTSRTVRPSARIFLATASGSATASSA